VHELGVAGGRAVVGGVSGVLVLVAHGLASSQPVVC
jgi:hypothetical protein